MAEVKLYGSWSSPFSYRIEVALKLKGVEYEFIDEDVHNKKSPLLLKYNLVHKKVPVLVHNDKPICESLVILEYIDETWEGPSIWPGDPYERATARLWAKFFDEKCVHAMWKVCWSKGEEQEKLKKECTELLKILESTLSGKKFFRTGETIGMVDVTGNFVAYWFGILQELAGLQVFTKEKFPNENLPPEDKLAAHFQARFRAVAASK
ncbi:unnamed protein product [Fraxinus pennsylvanica]|uniref:glutathione transferase n=1 Tax=Fraxinus pennsylvanica TaxID=56036 RepID=A0AAD1Z3A5_9LAMI|nr:unnamed protein product [Fraxinus pennsylvanica]